MLRFALVALVAVGFTSFAQAADQKASEFVLCKNKAKNVRTLRVMGDAKNCKVTYSKGGVEEQVGEHSSKESCSSIVDRMKETLQSSNWNCKEVGTATVTTSSEVSRQ
jgi:hypothetical protein